MRHNRVVAVGTSELQASKGDKEKSKPSEECDG
jgi:hypothetical protein